MGRRLPAICILSVLLLGAAAIYAAFDPAQTWWMPRCPVNYFTGLSCPGCGSQRALHALLHGDVRGAFAHNAALLLLAPFLAVMGYAEITRRRNPRLYRILSGPAVIFTIVAVVTVWTVLRNVFTL